MADRDRHKKQIVYHSGAPNLEGLDPTCQHVKRAEVDSRLAAGEPGSEIAKDYGINPSSLHRHRANCLKLASSSAP